MIVPHDVGITWVDFNDTRTRFAIIKHLNVAVLDPGRMMLTMRFGVFETNVVGFVVDHTDPIVVTSGENDVAFGVHIDRVDMRLSLIHI